MLRIIILCHHLGSSSPTIHPEYPTATHIQHRKLNTTPTIFCPYAGDAGVCNLPLCDPHPCCQVPHTAIHCPHRRCVLLWRLRRDAGRCTCREHHRRRRQDIRPPWHCNILRLSDRRTPAAKPLPGPGAVRHRESGKTPPPCIRDRRLYPRPPTDVRHHRFHCAEPNNQPLP